MVMKSRQILGNKPSLLCQHDHLHLMTAECKSGGGKSAGTGGGGLGKLLKGGATGEE